MSRRLANPEIISQKEALFNEYYRSESFKERLWLPTHSARNHFRIEKRDADDSAVFLRVKTGISDPDDLQRIAERQVPSGVFFTPVQWLDPIHLRLTRNRVRDCMLTSPLYFDIDIKRPIGRIRNAVKVVSKLTHMIRRLSQRDADLLVFSGSSGFHLYYWNWDDIPSRYEHPRDRIRGFTESRKSLLKRIKLEEIDVDHTVTADPWRILRVPGTLHWETGLVACVVPKVEDFVVERDAAIFPEQAYQTVFGLDPTVF